MPQQAGIAASDLAGTGPAPFVSRMLAEGADWSIGDYVCRAGPGDRPYEEQHARVTIAAVIAGSFSYRGAPGPAFLHPGAFLLGNAGTCFECGHDHSRGDRCVAFHLSSPLFEEIAASVTGSARYRFPMAMLPAGGTLAPALAEFEAMAHAPHVLAPEEAVARLAETVLAGVSGERRAPSPPSASDQRRIAGALRHIEARADAPLDLASLAAVACMSKYHFLRTFRRCVGMTPYQFVLGVRLRRAAVRLRTTPAPVAAIAFDAGFGDLSTFNARFRAVFGDSPRAYRTRRGSRAARSA